MKQLLKDTTKYGVEKIGVQIRASVGHFFFPLNSFRGKVKQEDSDEVQSRV